MSIHPIWVYELVAAVERHEDEHPEGGGCLADALEQVPGPDRDMAAGLAVLKRRLATAETRTPPEALR